MIFERQDFARRRVSLLSALLAAAGVVQGQVVLTGPYDVNRYVPDGDISGIADTRVLNQAGVVSSMTVSVVLSGESGLNGDIYLGLMHGSGYAVLLNRAGVTAANPSGYGDSGFSVSFSDAAEAGDVHTYRTALFDNPDVALLGSLSGSWAPSGRDADPDSTTDLTPRTAMLSSFNGLGVAGEWTLFAADLRTGHQLQLQSWSMSIVASVPEPAGAAGLTLVLAGAGVVALRTWRPRS